MIKSAMSALGEGPGAGPGGGPGGGQEGEDGKISRTRQGFEKLIKWVVSTVNDIRLAIATIVVNLPLLYAIMWSIVGIAVLLGVLALVIYLMYYLHPRIPQPFHSENLDDYLDTMCAELSGEFRKIAEADLTWLTGMEDDVRALKDACAALSERRSTIVGELKTYFQFYDSLAGKLGFLGDADLRNNLPELVDTKDGHTLLTKSIKDEVVKPLDRVFGASERISSSLLHSGDLRTRFGTDVVGTSQAKTATSIHTIRMLITQRDELGIMAMSRRKNFPMGIWLIYYWPIVKNIYTIRIPGVWIRIIKTAESWRKAGFRWWYRLGQEVALLPCKMAFSDPEERANNCKSQTQFGGGDEEDTFSGGSPLSPEQKARKVEEDEMREGFGLGSLIGSVTSLVQTIVPIGRAIYNLILGIATDPFNTLIQFMMLFIGMIIGIVLTLLHTLFSFASFIVITWYAYVGALVVAWWYTIWLVFLSGVLGIAYFLLWLVTSRPTASSCA